MLAWVLTFLAVAQPAPTADIAFNLGAAPVSVDLRNMLRDYIVQKSCQALDETAKRRAEAVEAGDAQAWRDNVRAKVRDALDLPKFDNPLNVRAQSRHDLPAGGMVENVLFESLPGWDVNATIFLPDPAAYPPPWIPVIIPVGHSGKQMPSYQLPAQAFARLGYAAITFDPPGMAGEKTEGNDHFNDGVRCYLTGQSSNRYFIADALRCLDYLQTRSDINMMVGAAMTGVSGGGCTTMFAALLDSRIRVAGPACTAVPMALHPVLDCYAPCTETLDPGRFTAYDDVDVLAAAMPTPLMLMAGATDEVFKRPWSEQIAASVTEAYEKTGNEGRFRFFLDPGGHDYTIAMAVEFTRWMDQWLRGEQRNLPSLTKDDIEEIPADWMKCNPRPRDNMFTLNRARAIELRDKRSGLDPLKAAAKLCSVDRPAPAPSATEGAKTLAWFHWVQELSLRPEAGIELPATYLYPSREGWKGAAVLYFDDRGRWTNLRQQKLLSELTGFTVRETDGPAVLTVDLRGWGDSTPADVPYDIAGWAGRDRWTSYVSAALGDHIFAMRVRDGLAALAWLRSRPEIDPARIVIGGRGAGGLIALHVAAADAATNPEPHARAAFAERSLAAFDLLATTHTTAFTHDYFFPGVLLHYDLPDLAAHLPFRVLVLNPLGDDAEPLKEDKINILYAHSDLLTARGGVTDEAARTELRDFVKDAVAP